MSVTKVKSAQTVGRTPLLAYGGGTDRKSPHTGHNKTQRYLYK